MRHKAGVKCVIGPGGSIRDDEIIEAANSGMALYWELTLYINYLY